MNKKKFNWVLLGTALVCQLGAGLWAAAHGEWRLAAHCLGLFLGWWAFWDRLVSVDCQIGDAARSLKRINGEVDEAGIEDRWSEFECEGKIP